MTAIDVTADIPSNINTLERLAVWAVVALRRVNPTLQVLELPGGQPERAAQAAIIQADDDTIRMFGRISIPLDSGYAETNGVKLWMHAQELSNTALPAAFKSN